MKESNVEHIVDLAALPALTEAERADLADLRDMPDDDIDRSDIPALAEAAWGRAVPVPIRRAGRTPTVLRLDDDVLAWFQAQGGEYEARINAVLRRAMLDASGSRRG